MWEKVKLGEICKIRTGKLDVNAENPTGLYPFFTCSKNHTYIDDYAFNEEAIIVAGNGDLNVKYYKGKFNAYQRTYVINPFNNINGKFLFYFLDQYVSVLRNESIGGVIKYIKLGNLTEALIPLPPLHIQEKIAEILDKADELRRKDQELQDKYDQLAQAIFIDMFGDPVKNEKGWEVKKLEELIIKLETGCSVNSIEKVDSNSTNLYILKTSCVYDGNFRLSERKIVAPNDIKRLKTNPKSNSIIISRMNTPELVAKSAYVKSGSKDTFLPDRLWQSIHSELPHNVLWLSYLLGTKKMLVEIQKKASGTSGSMKNISKVDFLNTKIIFPPIHLQEEFAKKIEIIHQLKAQTNAEKSEELFQSLLQKAFKGELVS